MHKQTKTVTIAPQETVEWRLDELRVHSGQSRTGYQGYVILMYDETGQLLSQYNEQADTFSNNVRFSWLQSANAGLFIVYNEIDERGIGAPPRGREFIIKYSRIFDVFN